MSQPSRTADKVVIRLPDGFRRELKIRAARNDRSLNGEVVNMLKSVIEEEAASQPSA